MLPKLKAQMTVQFIFETKNSKFSSFHLLPSMVLGHLAVWGWGSHFPSALCCGGHGSKAVRDVYVK